MVFSITVVPSQNLSAPNNGALTNAPLAPLRLFLVFQTSIAAFCYNINILVRTFKHVLTSNIYWTSLVSWIS